MLVLSRQRDETIMIGDDVEITVVDIRGDKIRLGISAPTKIAVHRKEVYEAIEAENRRASALGSEELGSLCMPGRHAGGEHVTRLRINTAEPVRSAASVSKAAASAVAKSTRGGGR